MPLVDTPLQARSVDIVALVAGMRDLVASTTGATIQLEFDVATGLPFAFADAHQAPGVGTKVELWLPTTDLVAGDIEPTKPGLRLARSGTALVVDDEDLVRSSTADMLTDMGYAVVEAASAEEALRLFEGGLAPDLLVTDHLMPGLSGAELVNRIAARPLQALIVSGYADVEGIAPDLPRLVKSFRQVDLAQAIAALTVNSDTS